MGNDLNLFTKSTTTLSEEEYLLEELLSQNNSSNRQSISDTHFGDIYLKENNENKPLSLENSFIKQLSCFDEETFLNCAEKLNKRQNISHPNLLKLHKIKSSKETLLCSNSYKITMLIEYIKRDLSSEIRSKRLQSTRFTNEELIKFIKDIVSVLAYLQKKGISLGHLRSFYIFIDHNQRYKVFENELLGFPSNLSQCLMNAPHDNESNYSSILTSGVYLSPELMNLLKSPNSFQKVNAFKSEVFTLGMILLEMLSLKTMDSIFDYENYEIRERSLKEFIENYTKNGILKEISQFIQLCLTFDFEKRPDFIDLEQKIHDFFESEKNLEGEYTETIKKGPRNSKKVKAKAPIFKSSPIKEDFDEEKHIPQRKKEEEKKSLWEKENEDPERSSQKNELFYDSFQSPPKQHFSENILGLRPDPTSNPPSKLRQDSPNPEFFINDEIITLGDIQQKQILPKMYEKYEDGSIYSGEFLDGIRDGKGVISYPDGGMYEGGWKLGQMHGYGILFYPNKEIAYEGFWHEGKFHGEGKIFNEDMEMNEEIYINYKNFSLIGENWVRYEGMFDMDNKHGQGILIFKDGSRFEGSFISDAVDGDGTYYFRDGRSFSGEWLNNKLVKVY